MARLVFHYAFYVTAPLHGSFSRILARKLYVPYCHHSMNDDGVANRVKNPNYFRYNNINTFKRSETKLILDDGIDV